MKKLLMLLSSIALTTTAFTQIKANRTITKSYEPAKQNVAIMAAINTNADSVEIAQLFNAYKITDADVTNKLEKLLAKIKIVNEKNANKIDDKTKAESELAMVRMQSLISQRGTMLAMITNMINGLNESMRTIMQNIGR